MLLAGARPETVGRMKQFAGYFTRGVRHGAQLRRQIFEARDARHILGLVDAFFQCQAVAEAS